MCTVKKGNLKKGGTFPDEGKQKSRDVWNGDSSQGTVSPFETVWKGVQGCLRPGIQITSLMVPRNFNEGAYRGKICYGGTKVHDTE